MLTAISDERQFAVILNNVPNSIERVLDCVPISALVNAGAERSNIEAVLAIEIARISKLLTVGGNLREGQSIEIAMQLIQDYPNESLEDFCLCLRRGVKGAYGEIFRFDILVIYEWFKKYLEEKYIVAENKLRDERDSMYSRLVVPEPVRSFKRVWDYPAAYSPVKDSKARLILWQLQWDAMSKTSFPKPPPLTNEDVLTEGQIKPKPKRYVPEVDPAEWHMKDYLHKLWVKENFDVKTGEKLSTWISEEEWLKKKEEEIK
jgi:hypothetical protein